MNLKLYQPKIRWESKSVFGHFKREIPYNELIDKPLVKAFLEDDEIQTMTIASSNIGFVKTYTKVYKVNKI